MKKEAIPPDCFFFFYRCLNHRLGKWCYFIIFAS